jgi:hypothetical protein
VSSASRSLRANSYRNFLLKSTQITKAVPLPRRRHRSCERIGHLGSNTARPSVVSRFPDHSASRPATVLGLTNDNLDHAG